MLAFLPLCLSIFAHNETPSDAKSGYFEPFELDATEEVIQIERQNSAPKDDKQTQQMIFSVFSNMVQSMFNIALNKDNPTTIATNIVSVVNNIATIAAECAKSLPIDMPEQEYQKCIGEIETVLKRCLRSVSLVKKQHSIKD